jgi:hypothetical protein
LRPPPIVSLLATHRSAVSVREPRLESIKTHARLSLPRRRRPAPRGPFAANGAPRPSQDKLGVDSANHGVELAGASSSPPAPPDRPAVEQCASGFRPNFYDRKLARPQRRRRLADRLGRPPSCTSVNVIRRPGRRASGWSSAFFVPSQRARAPPPSGRQSDSSQDGLPRRAKGHSRRRRAQRAAQPDKERAIVRNKLLAGLAAAPGGRICVAAAASSAIQIFGLAHNRCVCVCV